MWLANYQIKGECGGLEWLKDFLLVYLSYLIEIPVTFVSTSLNIFL